MSVVSLSVTILRPVGDVFAVLTDVGNAAKWSSALEEQLITPGPLRIGSRRRAVVPTFAGRSMENEMELTELVPDRSLAMRGVAGFPFPVPLRPSGNLSYPFAQVVRLGGLTPPAHHDLWWDIVPGIPTEPVAHQVVDAIERHGLPWLRSQAGG